MRQAKKARAAGADALRDHGERFWESLFDATESSRRDAAPKRPKTQRSSCSEVASAAHGPGVSAPGAVAPAASPTALSRSRPNGVPKPKRTAPSLVSQETRPLPSHASERRCEAKKSTASERPKSEAQPNCKSRVSSQTVVTADPQARASSSHLPKASADRFHGPSREKLAGGARAAPRGPRRSEDEADYGVKQEFNSIVREIRKLTFPSLGKFERMKIQAAEMKASGRKPDTLRRMPLPELRLRRAAAERAIDKQIMQERELGVKLYHGKKTLFQAEKDKRLERAEKRRRAEAGRLTSSAAIGYEKNGHLKLGSQLRQKYTR